MYFDNIVKEILTSIANGDHPNLDQAALKLIKASSLETIHDEEKVRAAKALESYKDKELKVYRINDHEWWQAYSLEDAKAKTEKKQ